LTCVKAADRQWCILHPLIVQWEKTVMRRSVALATAAMVALSHPVIAEEPAGAGTVQQPAVQAAEAPIAVTPGSVAAGSAAGVVVILVVLGVVAIAASSL
jgi:hypothetical protein